MNVDWYEKIHNSLIFMCFRFVNFVDKLVHMCIKLLINEMIKFSFKRIKKQKRI